MKREELLELVTVIKKFVRDEVRKQVDESKKQIKSIVTEEMNNQMTKLLAEVIRGGAHQQQPPAPTTSRSQGMPQPLNEHVMMTAPQPQQVRGKTHQFNKTGNPALDAILSQTVSDITPDSVPIGEIGDSSTMEELRKIGDTEKVNFQEMFAPRAAEVVIDKSSNINMLKSLVSAGSNMDTPSALDVPENINPIGQALKKDFRSMMKNIDGIKDRMRSGPMAMPQIDPNEWRRLDAEGQ
jgi:predicted metal-dependent peptidase